MNYDEDYAINTVLRILRLSYNSMMSYFGKDDHTFSTDFDKNGLHYYEIKGSDICGIEFTNYDRQVFKPFENYEVYEFPSKNTKNSKGCGKFYCLIYSRRINRFYVGELIVNKIQNIYKAKMRLDDDFRVLVDPNTKRFKLRNQQHYKNFNKNKKLKTRRIFDYSHCRRNVYLNKKTFHPKKFRLRFKKI